MNDITGKPLSINDKVVFIPQDGYTSQLSTGIVEGFTKQKVKIKATNKAWRYSGDNCLKYPEQVAKIDET